MQMQFQQMQSQDTFNYQMNQLQHQMQNMPRPSYGSTASLGSIGSVSSIGSAASLSTVGGVESSYNQRSTTSTSTAPAAGPAAGQPTATLPRNTSAGSAKPAAQPPAQAVALTHAERTRDFYREFLGIPKKVSQVPDGLIDYFASDVIQTSAIDTPFGIRPLVIADFVSSSRALRSVEHALTEFVMPHYGGTQSGTFGVGLSYMTKQLVKDANTLVKQSFGAKTDEYAAVFTEMGPRAFVRQLVMDLDVSPLLKEAQRVVLLVAASEDPDSMQVWDAAGALVVPIGYDPSGMIDLRQLNNNLLSYKDNIMLIAYFPAACHVTGVMQPVHDIAKIVHSQKRLVFFDYSVAAPFVNANISGTRDPLTWPDGIYSSTNNLLGGPGARSVILVRHSLDIPIVKNVHGVPARRDFVLTPFSATKTDVMGDIRAGFACLVKTLSSPQTMQLRHLDLTRTHLARLTSHPKLVILGAGYQNRLPLISFLILGPESRKLLHPRFVRRLLSDVFGIQAWSGWSPTAAYHFERVKIGVSQKDKTIKCFAGALDPSFAGKLTGGETKAGEIKPGPHEPITISNSAPFEMIAPGYTRVDLSFTHSPEAITYIVDAILWIADNGYRLLSMYEPLRAGADWYPVPCKTLGSAGHDPMYHPLLPKRPHMRVRKLDVRKYIAATDRFLADFWHEMQFTEVAGMRRNKEHDAYYGPSGASGGVDGKGGDDSADGESIKMEPWYLTKENVNEYMISSKKILVGFSHVPLMQRARGWLNS
ncbi:pyridoxal phosphate-dependent transferase [Entophlyctis helioformis]|nr:pyridoxal phosphate-dependent transferase [Entophlyctis helioformis]